MSDLICLLDRWQTLVGAVLGGAFALATALIVAQSATRREQRIAAMLLTADVLSVYATAENLKNSAAKNGISSEEYPLWVSEELSWRRPRLSTLFEAQMARMMDVDEALAAHLTHFKMAYSAIDDHIMRIKQDTKNLSARELPVIPRPRQDTEADAAVVAEDLTLAAEHAACAHHLLAELVLSRVPRFIKRLRMWLHPSEQEKTSRKLLDIGRI